MLKFEKTARYALIVGIMVEYETPSLMMLHDFERNTNYVCVIIGVDFDFNKKVVNKFKILDMNKGELEIDANDRRILEVACFYTGDLSF